MATLTEIKNQFAQNSLSNPTNKASSGLLTDNQRQAAFVRYQKEQEEKEKNQGGFWGGLGYVFEKIGLGFLQSIEGIWDYTAGGLADLFGAHDWAEKQMANDWVNYGHADEWFNPSDGWKVAGDVAGGIGTSLPALGAVAAAAAIAFFSGGTLAPAAAGLIGGVVAGLGAAGTATKEAYRETGELNGAAWGYGTLSGFTEGVMEGVSDVIGFGVGSIAKNLAKSTAKEGAKQVGKQIAKSAVRQTFGKAILSSFLSEAFEEGVQELLDPVWKRVTYDPNAENATFQEVAYAALIGGLSGAIMGGADVTVRNSINYFSGSRINGKGGAKGVIDLATTIAETEGVNQSGNAQVDFVVNTLSELQESLQKTNGEVKTAKQKMLVGILSKANTAAPLSIVVSQNADAIVHDAETTVKRLNDIGYKTSDGKTVTPEMLTQGVTGERGTREYRRSLSDAMRTNEALRTVAVMSAAGQLNMDAARFQESTLRGEQLATQADLNHFIETATEAQKRDVGERLGITDWATVTADELKSRVREFSENGGVDQYINERNEVKKLSELEISKKGLPKYVGSITQDGAVRYKFGDASVAIVKNGDTYRVYDYARDVISKPLSKKEANRVIKEIYAASTVSETSSDTQSVPDSQKQTQEIDTFAREHVTDYKRITGAQQQAVRQTLRQARAAKISEADQILYASVAARSGANIEFVSAETLGENADAGYSMKDGKILVNRDVANSPKARTAAKILLHEFTHAMIHRGYSVKGKKGKQHIENKVLNDFFTTAIKGLSAEQQLQILTPYIERHGVSVQDFIDGKVDISIDTYIELREELAAHFVEREIGNSAALKRIISDKPTFKDKLLAFLKRAKSDYGTTNEKMSRAANALLKKYQTFFNQYATQTRFSPSIKGDLTASDSDTAAGADTQTRLSIKQIDGKNVVVIDTDQHIFEGVTDAKELRRIARNYILDNFRNDVYKTTDGKGVIFTRKGAKKITNTEYLSKIRISTELDNFIKTAEYVKTVPNAKNVNPEFSYFDYYRASFVLDGKMFDCLINVGVNTQTGAGVFYEITQIKEAPHNSLDGNVPVAPASNGTSTDIIPDNNGNVNTNGKKNSKKRFALAGKASETADISMLERAKQLQASGENSESIRKQTGWFIGYDKQWRYEIDDSAAALVENPVFENHNADGGIYRTAKLGDIMRHEKLYAAYPFLKDVTVILQETDTGVDGIAFAKDGQIVLDQRLFTRTSKEYRQYIENRQPEIKRIEQTPEYREYNRFYTDESLQETLSAEEWLAQEETARNKFFASELGKKYYELMWGKPSVKTTEIGWSDKAKAVLMHEVQHLIQAHEGFSGGSSNTYWYERLLKQHRKDVEIARDKFLKLRSKSTPELQQAMYDMEDVASRRNVSQSAIESAYENAVKYAKDDNQRNVLRGYMQAYSKLADFYKNGHRYADDMYTNTAGEIEARDVQQRLEMTADQRRETRPDIDRESVYLQGKSKGNEALRYALHDVEQEAVKHFGHTYKWAETGYVLTDGSRLDFSGRHEGASGGYRTVDHREIGVLTAYENTEGSDSLIDFMKRGNIRILPEYGGINLSVLPTKAQENALSDFISKNRGEITLDIDDTNGNTVVSVEYPRGTHYSKILQDIRNYFNDGTKPVVSELSKFRYALSETDSQGRVLTVEQRKFFNDSKVVDKNGRLLTMYHATFSDFTVFDIKKTSDINKYGQGHYFTSSITDAEAHYMSAGNSVNSRNDVDSKIESMAFDLFAEHGYSYEDSLTSDADIQTILDDCYKQAEKYYSRKNAKLITAYLNVRNPLYVRKGKDVSSVYDYVFVDNDGKIVNIDGAKAASMGYDGIIDTTVNETLGGVDNGTMHVVVFSPEQIKLTTNKMPTGSNDIRYALNPTESDNSGAIGGLTRGQRAKFVANNTRFKVYSKMDAASVIDAIIAERLTPKDGNYDVKLSGKNRAEVIEKLFTKLNNTPEGYRLGVALDIADYMINNAVLTEMFDTYNDDSYTMGVLSVIRGYMHRMDLSGIQSEIQHKFDKKNSINLVWGAKSGGIAPDVVAQELEGYGIRFNSINAADQFFEMLEIYEHAREQVNKKAESIMLTAYGSETEIEHLRQEIARDVLNAYDEKGTPSKYAKLVEKYTKKIASLREDLSTAYKRNTLVNRIIDGAAYLRDIATKRNYVGAEIFSAPELTSWLKQLSKIRYRSDLRKAGARKILLDYGLFYNTNNALLYDENPDLNYIDENVIDALNFIRQNALSNKPLSMEELQAAQVIIASAKHLFNTYDQITIEGKKRKISELATEGNEIIKKSKNRTSKGFFNRIYGVFNKIIEPRVVIKSLENFDPNGILTRAYNEVTRGETEAALLYIELTNDIDTYIKKHKHFKKRLSSEYITVAGAELTIGQAISLYELSKRPQAQEGLRESGFSYIDKKGSKQTAHITDADIATLFDAFTDTDKGFIELVETFFNVASKQVKTDADIEILGYTNASEEFYFPIKRDSGTIAKNITDARSIMADWANVYNFSFNKDVKTGAKNKLFVTDVYSVITRHAKQLSTYARMTVPLKNFSQIYAKNIGDKTNVISIRNTVNEQVWGGAEGYLSKLFADIQGRATSSSFIEKMRGAYAKYQLGANLKVIVSQITSYPTAGVLLDTGVMAKGFVMRTNWAAMDKYCPYARVRNYERGIVRAEGVVDKVGKAGDVLTKPIQWTDRFTIGRLWNACQLQIQKDTGLKYGSVENMQKAGALLEDVIRLTQPNYTNTERSELMRSDSDIVRSFTMFTSVPLKQLSRLVESFGEYNALRSLVKTDKTDATAKRYKLAKKKLRRTLAAVTIANLMYVLVGQFFKFLYNDMAEDEKEGKVTAKSFFLDMLNDFGSTTVGMLPVVRDIYGYFANGYEINSFTGDMLNGILSTTKQLFELATKAASGEDIKTQDYMSVFRNSLYGIGQITGIPVRNINNTITGLIRRFNPSAAYSYTSLFYNPKYSKDINAALKKGDYELAETIMGMMLNDDRTGSLNGKATRKLIELYDAGYTVLPKSIDDTLTYKGEEIRLTSAQQSTFKAIYGKANAEIEKTVNSMAFATLPAEQQAKAIKLIYDAYYSRAQSTVLNLPNDNRIMLLSGAIPPSALAPCLSAISAIDSDTDKKGNVINASKKEKVIKYVLAQKLTTAQKLLLILSLGYTIKDGDIKGVSAAKAKSVVARYISNLSLSRAEKTALAEKCGLKVRNGRIYAA